MVNIECKDIKSITKSFFNNYISFGCVGLLINVLPEGKLKVAGLRFLDILAKIDYYTHSHLLI
jgi:hypothetical protein